MVALIASLSVQLVHTIEHCNVCWQSKFAPPWNEERCTRPLQGREWRVKVQDRQALGEVGGSYLAHTQYDLEWSCVWRGWCVRMELGWRQSRRDIHDCITHVWPHHAYMYFHVQARADLETQTTIYIWCHTSCTQNYLRNMHIHTYVHVHVHSRIVPGYPWSSYNAISVSWSENQIMIYFDCGQYYMSVLHH